MERYYLITLLLIFMVAFYRGLDLYKTRQTTFDGIMLNLAVWAWYSVPVYFVVKVING